MIRNMEPGTYFTSLGMHASTPGFGLGSSFSLQSLWCCISLHPGSELLHAHCLACSFFLPISTELPVVLDGLSMLFRTCLDHDKLIVIPTNKARFVPSTPFDHRLLCLRQYHHFRHRRAHQLRQGAFAIH